MTNEQKRKCEIIIHSNAVAAAAGNAVPIPGLDLLADVSTMSIMAMLLASELGGDITQSVARNLAISALKKQALKKPLTALAKSTSKYVPVIGSAVSASFSVAMLEAAGWSMAKTLDKGRTF